MEVKYTIIIPHYNSPSRLRILLDSIPKTPSVQVIVVDDNSTRGLAELEAVVQTDGRAEFLRNDTGIQSAGACRNIGLSHARGKWVLFSDADDYFLPGFLEHLDAFYDSPADIIFFTPTSINIETGKPAGRHTLYAGLVERYLRENPAAPDTPATLGSPKPPYTPAAPDTPATLGGSPKSPDTPASLNLRYRFCVPWSKMLRRSLIEENQIEFEPVAASNDIMFCTKAALCAKTFEASRETIYCVTKDSGTLMTTPSEQNLDVRIDVLVRRCRLLRENLSVNEYKKLDISGELMLYRSLQWFGIKKLRATARILRKNKVKLLTLSPFNFKVALSILRG